MELLLDSGSVPTQDDELPHSGQAQAAHEAAKLLFPHGSRPFEDSQL